MTVLLLVVEPVTAHVVPVIAEIHRQHVLEPSHPSHALHEPADVPVEVLDHGVVGGQMRAHLRRVGEVRPHLQRAGIEALPLVRNDQRKVGRRHRQHEKQRLVEIVAAQVLHRPVGEGVGLVAIQRRRIGVVELVDRAVEVAVQALEPVPVLEACAEVLGRAVARPSLVAPRRILGHRRRHLVAHDAAMPFAEVGGAVAELAQQRGRARRRGLEDVEEPRHRSGVRVTAGEDRPP